MTTPNTPGAGDNAPCPDCNRRDFDSLGAWLEHRKTHDDTRDLGQEGRNCPTCGEAAVGRCYLKNCTTHPRNAFRCPQGHSWPPEAKLVIIDIERPDAKDSKIEWLKEAFNAHHDASQAIIAAKDAELAAANEALAEARQERDHNHHNCTLNLDIARKRAEAAEAKECKHLTSDKPDPDMVALRAELDAALAAIAEIQSEIEIFLLADWVKTNAPAFAIPKLTNRLAALSTAPSASLSRLKAEVARGAALKFLEGEYLEGRGVPKIGGWKSCIEHLIRKAKAAELREGGK